MMQKSGQWLESFHQDHLVLASWKLTVQGNKNKYF